MSRTELNNEDRIYKVFETQTVKEEKERRLKSECELITGRRCGECDQCLELNAREELAGNIYNDFAEGATRMAIIVDTLFKVEEEAMVLRRENKDLRKRVEALEKWAAATDRTLEHHGVV